MRAIYCTNFGYQTRESELKSLFSRYGNVVRIEMETGSYAFVYFEDDNDAEKAILGLNGHMPSGSKFHGCRLVVQWGNNDHGSHGSSGSNPIPNRALFVAKFDPILTKCHDIKTHFEPYGKVLSVRIHPDYAFVHFKTQEDATKALECTHLSTLFDRLLCVGYALRRDDNEKGRCDGLPNPRAMSPDPPRASPVNDRCDGPPNSRAMSPDPARASPVRDIEGSNSIFGINSEPFCSLRQFAFVEATKCSKVLFQSTCKTNIPPSSLRFKSHSDHVLDTVDQTTDGDGNGDGSSSGDSSDNDGSDDDDGGGSGDDGGVEGIDGFVTVVTLESEEIVFTNRIACKLFGVNPGCRSHVITVLPQENDSELGRLGKEFEVILLGEGFFTYETVDGRTVNRESEWNYRIRDKMVPEEIVSRPPSWHEEVLRHVYVRNATIAVFGNHNGHVNVLFLVCPSNPRARSLDMEVGHPCQDRDHGEEVASSSRNR